jgi:hypothetical protein
MPLRWTAGAAPLLRRYSGCTLFLRAVAAENAVHLIASFPLRRAHVTGTTKPSHSSMSSPSTSSSLNDEPNTEMKFEDTKITFQNPARNYLDAFQRRLRTQASLLSSSATLNLAEIGGRLNKVTGYEHIERLKHKVVETGAVPLVSNLGRGLIGSRRGSYICQATGFSRRQSGL